MMYFNPNNIYLCDLEFLGASIDFFEGKLSKGRKAVCVTLPGELPCEFVCEQTSQGWHVISGVDVNLREFADGIAKMFDSRERFTYFCFTKIREAKMRVTKTIRMVLIILSVTWAWRFIAHGLFSDAACCLLAVAMIVTSCFLPREILRHTYQDYLRDLEKRDGPGPTDFYDWFGNAD